RQDYSLLAERGGTFTSDQFDKLELAGGFLVIEGLEAGDYSLKIKRENCVVPIRVTAGERVGRFAVSKRRILETAHREPLHIIGVAEDEEELVIKLANADETTRVHVLGTRFKP